MVAMNCGLDSVRGFFILDSEGKRILAKYYSSAFSSSLKAQQQFEKVVYDKTKKNTSSNSVALIDGYIVIYRTNLDVMFYIITGLDENELTVSTVLDTFYDALTDLFKASSANSQIDKKNMLLNYDLIAMVLDELIDNGIILECDVKSLTSKISKREFNDAISAEQAMSHVLSFAKDQLSRTFSK